MFYYTQKISFCILGKMMNSRENMLSKISKTSPVNPQTLTLILMKTCCQIVQETCCQIFQELCC
jgi:hypothetical protein